MSRRSALGVLGATAAATTLSVGTPAFADPAGLAAPAGKGTTQPDKHGIQLLLNGKPAKPGVYNFPTDIQTVVLDNGLIRYTFGRDDAVGGVVSGWTDVSITATSVIVNGTELAHNLNGVEPRDPDRQHSFYIDAAGGKSRLVCTQIKVIRVEHDLVEIAFADTVSTPLRHEHHLIMRGGKRGLYGYDILTALASTSISEVRMNTRWDRGIFDHAYNWERGKGQQPTYAYCATQQNLQDETWRVDGINNQSLPSPESNSGNLPPGSVYTKYNWSLYHYQNPMFGHYGKGFGTWFTPLGGVTDETLCAFYGVGPNRQDLAIHQDALILNYFGPNHYGLPGYRLTTGYQRLYGPWYSYITVGDPTNPDAMIAEAAHIARSEIAENRPGSTWIADPLYPKPNARSTVSGRLRLTDGRPASNFWALLSTQDVDDVYTIHEPTYFVKTDEDGNFTLPGIPPAWAAGTTTPSSYVLYLFAADGSVTDQLKVPGIVPKGSHHKLGDVKWAPALRTTFLWQIGKADRTGGEFALATQSPAKPSPRAYEKPGKVPGDLTFTVGSSWEPKDWYYAQTTAGTWTIEFSVDRALTGTAYLTVASSMKAGNTPTITVNGSADGLSGALATVIDTVDGQKLPSISRQADRSGFPRVETLSFPADRLHTGKNTITFTRGSGLASGDGMGWDTVLLQVDEATAPKAAKLVGDVVRATSDSVTLKITNRGKGSANDVRLDGVSWADKHTSGSPSANLGDGRDPNAFPVPVAATIAPGRSVTVTVRLDQSHGRRTDRLELGFTADGGRTRGSVTTRSR
jgi:rhamnogalacturonan endolyase